MEAPPNQLRAAKSQLLVNAGLNEFAIRELQAEQGGQGANWATLMIARIYEDSGQNHRAIQFLKKAMPGYYSVDLAALPRQYWEILFPRPYWTDLQRQADGELAGPVSGGFADPAGERVQSRSGVARRRLWTDAVAASGWPGRGAGGSHPALFGCVAAGAGHQHSTGHALLQGDGDAIQRAGGVRAGRLQCGFQPRG